LAPAKQRFNNQLIDKDTMVHCTCNVHDLSIYQSGRTRKPEVPTIMRILEFSSMCMPSREVRTRVSECHTA
jgi:hypothetical protein